MLDLFAQFISPKVCLNVCIRVVYAGVNERCLVEHTNGWVLHEEPTSAITPGRVGHSICCP